MALGTMAGKVVVLTGATGGIGAAIARRFAHDGANLVLTGRSQRRAADLLEELLPIAAAVDLVICDIRSSDAINALADRVSRQYGHIDALVLNAGAITFAPTCEVTTDQYDEMMDVNVRAPWMCVRALQSLLVDRATIVMTSSVSATMHFPGETVYCMSKAALTPLVNGLAIELADRGIRVNALCPGVIGEAGMSQDAIDASSDPSAEMSANTAKTPLARLGTLDEIADAALFLASEQSSFITGTSLVVDGGLSIARI